MRLLALRRAFDAARRGTANCLTAVPISLAALVSTTGGAQALQITQNVDFSISRAIHVPPSPLPNIVFPLQGNSPGSANRFDPALGTLNSVVIGISGTMTSSASGGFQGLPICPPAPIPTPCTSAARLQLEALEFKVQMPGINVLFPLGTRSIGCSGAFCAVNLPLATQSFSATRTVTGSQVSGFVGGGSFAVNSGQGGRLKFGTPNNALSTATGQVSTSGRINIVYNFSRLAPPVPVPVPEPSALALFGIGLLGLGLARRRRII